MKFNDAVFGVFFIVFAIAEIAYTWTFPSLHGQRFDSTDFPVLVGIGLIICGCTFLVKGLRQYVNGTTVGSAFVTLSDWIESNSSVINFFAVILSILFFIFCVDLLGFAIVAFSILLVLFLRFGNGFKVSMISAVVMTIVTKVLFGVWLLVPLPIGPLGF